MPLYPPDYLIDPQILLCDYLEKEVKVCVGWGEGWEGVWGQQIRGKVSLDPLRFPLV